MMGTSLVNTNSFTDWPIKSNSIDMIITSPPYYNARPEYAIWSTYMHYRTDMMRVLRQCYRVLKKGGRIAFNVPHGYDRPGNGGYKTVEAFFTAYMESYFELRGHIIWSKKGQSPQSGGTAWGSWKSASNPSLRDEHEVIIVAHKQEAKIQHDGLSTIDRETFLEATKSVWEISPISNHWHPAPFPPEIPRRLIELYTYKDDIVLDPFSGSGTTVHVARQLGRVGIGLDLSMEYLRQSAIPVALDYSDWERVRKLMIKGDKPLEDLPMWRIDEQST